MKTIDIHTHHPFSKNMVENKNNLAFMEKTSVHLSDCTTIDSLIKLMDQGGIDISCLLEPNLLESFNLTNEMIYNALQKYPERFIGFGGFNILDTNCDIIY